MQRSKDADHLAVYSDATYPVGPDASGNITYVHVPPMSPLSVIIIALASMAVAAFLCCYIYPVVRKCHGARTAKGHIKRPVLASARSLFGLRPQTPPRTPQLLARYRRLDMRIARPPPALNRSRGSFLSPSLSPSLSSSTSSSPSPSPSPTPIETPPMYSPSAISEVIVAPVDMGILGQIIESRATPKKGGDYYDSHKVEG